MNRHGCLEIVFCLAVLPSAVQAQSERPAADFSPRAANSLSVDVNEQKTTVDFAEPASPPRAPTTLAAPHETGDSPLSFVPRMIGDLPGTFGLKVITVPSVTTITTPRGFESVNNFTNGPALPVQVPTTSTATVLVPIASQGAFKVAENASPRPEDRVFFTYHYFDNVSAGARGGSAGGNQTVIVGQGFGQTVFDTTIPAVVPPRFDLHREVIGFEKTFFDGSASIEVRLPFFQQQGDGAFSENDVGDLSIILKYAPWYDRVTGNVLSFGLAVTAPTGPDIVTVFGDVHSTLLQPFVGFILGSDRWFVHGFSSVVIPTDDRDVTLLFNDLGLGYWLYRGRPDRMLSAIIPTLEAHVTTPLDHRSGASSGSAGAIYVPDLVVLTGGVHFGCFSRSTLTLGAATPLTGPRLFDVEAIVQFNMNF